MILLVAEAGTDPETCEEGVAKKVDFDVSLMSVKKVFICQRTEIYIIIRDHLRFLYEICIKFKFSTNIVAHHRTLSISFSVSSVIVVFSKLAYYQGKLPIHKEFISYINCSPRLLQKISDHEA